jgi:hypothetical protein
MAYTIVKSDGTVLTTVPDGTINTTSTSLGLPGRNYAGYGQSVDTNFVRTLENFADTVPPDNPIRGQLWFNINNNIMYVCPSDGETDPNNWLQLTSSIGTGTTTFGSVTITTTAEINSLSVINDINCSGNMFALNATLTGNITASNAIITTANLSTVNTTVIDAGSSTTGGVLTGTWTVVGNGTANSISGTAFYSNIGNIVVKGPGSIGIVSDYFYYSNGSPISFAGSYGNSNVSAYLPTYAGTIGDGSATATFNGRVINTGANTTAGNITGNWTLTAGSRLQATYADLAERFEADEIYEPGTVVELGGLKEITMVKSELSEDVFGVVSNTAAYLMNAGAGDDNTHPPIAVSGRVHVKVKGTVKKGDRLVSAGNGLARSAKQGEATAFNTLGRSLADKGSIDVGMVEAIVVIK